MKKIIKHVIQRHTYLHNLVFDKKPKERNEKDIKNLLDYENTEVELNPETSHNEDIYTFKE